MQLRFGDDWFNFLSLLSEKKPGVPLASYQNPTETLYIMMGLGELRRYTLNPVISPVMDEVARSGFYDDASFNSFINGASIWEGIMMGGIILPGMDILVRRDLGSGAPLRDLFAGIEIWGGIQGFLSNYYSDKCGGSYETYKISHNFARSEFSVLEMMILLKERFSDKATKLWELYEEVIWEALEKQQPKVHIPLK